MKRRHVLLCLAALAVHAPVHALTIAPPLDYWVRELFTKAIDQHNRREHLGDEDYFKLFAADTVATMKRQRAHPAKDFSAGPILNHFFGWGVLPGHEVSLVKVNRKPSERRVSVDLLVNGKPRRTIVNASPAGLHWTIENLSYSEGEDLLTFLRRRTAR